MRCAHGGKVKKNTWARYVKTEKHRNELVGEAVMKKLVGIWWGAKGGQN